MKKNKYDSFVVFDKGIKLPYVDKIVYGFIYDIDEATYEISDLRTHRYIEYLAGIIRWCAEGGTTSQDASTWYKDGKSYTPFLIKGGYISSKYLPESYALNPIEYKIIHGKSPKFGEDDLEHFFIVKNIIGEFWEK